jgi:hypothetical protein
MVGQIAICFAIVATIIAIWFAVSSVLLRGWCQYFSREVERLEKENFILRRNSEIFKMKVFTDTAKDILLRTCTAFLSSRAVAIGASLRELDLLSQINNIEIPANCTDVSIWDDEIYTILKELEKVIKSVKAEEGYREQEVLEIVTGIISETTNIMGYEIGDELYIFIKKIEDKKILFEAKLSSYIEYIRG